MKEIRTTLVFLIRDNQILLAMKKRGHGQGHYNGAGGKIDPGETVEQAMIRECQEEIGVTPITYTQVAQNTYYQPYKGEDCKNTVSIYLCTQWQGEPGESEEMAPEWFALDAIPYHSMWADDPHWLPQILQGRKLRAEFHYQDATNTIGSMNITEVTQLS